MVFFIVGFIIKLTKYENSWKSYIIFGFLLGIGYYVKAPLLLFESILLIFLIIITPTKINRKKLLITFLTFFLTILPYAIALSLQYGHLTVGESARENYLYHVNKLNMMTWTGHDLITFGSPTHPPRIINENPLTLEFAYPIAGTYPLHYDPAYWFAGFTTHFNVEQQFSAFLSNRWIYYSFFLESIPLIIGAIIFLLIQFKFQENFINRDEVWLIVWPLIVMFIYSLVYSQFRYVVPFLILFWIAIYKVLIVKVEKNIKNIILLGVVFFYVISLMVLSQKQLNELKIVDTKNYQPGYEVILSNLNSFGLKPLDRIAWIGDPYQCYFAHIGHLKIVAQINELQFQKLELNDFSLFIDRLKSFGIKAIVIKGFPPKAIEKGWKTILANPFNLSVFLI